ncbi:MAG: S-adenosylmethionine:tRNA ribosyltransferase-isomerase [Muribaculaceae bacterium]|nr:S-adenosylmethionine:tRNA ribosyltransferase-isomerase [Muribaculaceae bacterium]
MRPKNLKISNFDYPLPDDRIAKHPIPQRDKCKLLEYSPSWGIRERIFSDLPDLLPEDAMLVYNNTRVINARLLFRKPSGASIEIFCLEPVAPADYAENFSSTAGCRWLCFVGNSKRWKDGALTMEIAVGERTVCVRALRIEKVWNASVVEFAWDDSGLTFASVIEAAGRIPIPPYLNRDTEESDSSDYQTVYSHIDGSVAAPTAGLHFTDAVLEEVSRRGIPRRELTLHVGAGTFQPVKEDDVENHEMHSEFISVSLGLIEELASTPRKVIAVGTTSVRTLESLYHIGCLMAVGRWDGEVPQWWPYDDAHPCLSVKESLDIVSGYLHEHGLTSLVASTRIIIAPGYRYRIVKGMVTNFHQPKSTLLLLVSAFIGDAWRDVYDYALAHDFRFLSYGDACLFEEF